MVVASLFYIRSIRAGIGTSIATVFGLLVFSGVTELTNATMGQAAPTEKFYLIDGLPLAISETGQPGVVNLWASWCPPCRREMPLLARAAEDHPDVRFLFDRRDVSHPDAAT